MKTRCPRCGGEVEDKGKAHRPFCSERCKMIDLGHWIFESYRVPDRGQDEEEFGMPQAGPESLES